MTSEYNAQYLIGAVRPKLKVNIQLHVDNLYYIKLWTHPIGVVRCYTDYRTPDERYYQHNTGAES